MGERMFGPLTRETVFLGLFGKRHEVPISEGILERRRQAHVTMGVAGEKMRSQFFYQVARQ